MAQAAESPEIPDPITATRRGDCMLPGCPSWRRNGSSAAAWPAAAEAPASGCERINADDAADMRQVLNSWLGQQALELLREGPAGWVNGRAEAADFTAVAGDQIFVEIPLRQNLILLEATWATKNYTTCQPIS